MIAKKTIQNHKSRHFIKVHQGWLLVVLALVLLVVSLPFAVERLSCVGQGFGVLGIFNNRKEAPVKKLIHVSMLAGSLYTDYDKRFIQKWKCETGQTAIIKHLYGASGDQMRAVLQGKLHPDVLSMSNPFELDTIAEKTRIVNSNWRGDFPFDSSPYYSVVAFLVRRGNPKGIKDWDDLTKPDRSLLMSNPKTCGGGRWVYTAALGHGIKASNGDEANVREYLSSFYKNVPVLYSDQVVAGQAFVGDGKGDVLITYETFAQKQKQSGKPVELIVPSWTLAIDMPVAVAIKNTEKNKTTELARAYLNGLYDPKIQEMMVKHFFRPRLKDVEIRTSKHFPKTSVFRREDIFRDGEDIENKHLGSGGFFDSL